MLSCIRENSQVGELYKIKRLEKIYNQSDQVNALEQEQIFYYIVISELFLLIIQMVYSE